MKNFKFLQSAQITSDLWRYKMNSIQINSSKAYFIVGMMFLVLMVAFSSPLTYTQVQAAPGNAPSFESAKIRSGYCSANRSLVYRAILQRLDFAWSDGRGNALGLRDDVASGETNIKAANIQRLDFAWSDGRGNALGLRNSEKLSENDVQATNIQRLDFAWSDGKGNALGLRDGNIPLANNVLAAICP
jgi:hypothetical protein